MYTRRHYSKTTEVKTMQNSLHISLNENRVDMQKCYNFEMLLQSSLNHRLSPPCYANIKRWWLKT